jgi:hypothetical protein
MASDPKNAVPVREILLLGPYGVLGTGVVDAATPSLNSPMNLLTGFATCAAMSRELGLPLRFLCRKAGWNSLQEATDAELFGRATLC